MVCTAVGLFDSAADTDGDADDVMEAEDDIVG